jgi:hypothetical protein
MGSLTSRQSCPLSSVETAQVDVRNVLRIAVNAGVRKVLPSESAKAENSLSARPRGGIARAFPYEPNSTSGWLLRPRTTWTIKGFL